MQEGVLAHPEWSGRAKYAGGEVAPTGCHGQHETVNAGKSNVHLLVFELKS